MTSTSRTGDHPTRMMKTVRCPHCWHRFAPWDCLFIAGHDALRGDIVAGPDAFVRFRPSRFTRDGQAIDPGGVECRDIACPRCHLQVPRASLEFRQATISIVGESAAGKSYYLAAMSWRLRQTLPLLGWTLADADPAANTVLHDYEQTLFGGADGERLVRLEKTQPDDRRLLNEVVINAQTVQLPRPFQFTLTPTRPDVTSGHVLVLYDNAGEHFEPGSESTSVRATEHLAHSDVLFFLLDPAQDPRLRARISTADPAAAGGVQTAHHAGTTRQELVLNEAVVRIRKALGLSERVRHKALLVVVVAKADLIAGDLPIPGGEAEPVIRDTQGHGRFDFDSVGHASQRCRKFLNGICPELVSLAESAFRRVVYTPVSAAGVAPEVREAGGQAEYWYRPSQLKPRWTLAPLACALGYIEPTLAPQATGDAS